MAGRVQTRGVGRPRAGGLDDTGAVDLVEQQQVTTVDPDLRRQGSGSYVAELHPISNLLRVRDIAEEIAERVRKESRSAVEAAEARADARIREVEQAPTAVSA